MAGDTLSLYADKPAQQGIAGIGADGAMGSGGGGEVSGGAGSGVDCEGGSDGGAMAGTYTRPFSSSTQRFADSLPVYPRTFAASSSLASQSFPWLNI